MNKEEARELLKDKFEEIDDFEYRDLNNSGELRIYTDDGLLYFKPKQKFPIVIKNFDYTFSINRIGLLTAKNIHTCREISLYQSLDTLKEAVDKAIEIKYKGR